MTGVRPPNSTGVRCGLLESPSLRAFATNSLALADARAGHRDAAARGHRAALAWYRGSGSLSGIAFTTAALARVGPFAQAGPLLTSSWAAAMTTRDPRALALTAESRALIAGPTGRGARELGLADALRAATGRPRVPDEQPAVDALDQRLTATPGVGADRAAGERDGRDLLARLRTAAAQDGGCGAGAVRAVQDSANR